MIDFEKALDQLEHSHDENAGFLLGLLDSLDAHTRPLLYERARRTKIRYYGKTVYLRGLIEFSNYCNRACLYCGLRRGRSSLERYRLTEEEILSCCATGHALGYKTFVLQSGEDPYYTDERLVHLIETIKSRYPETALTLSVGERSSASYRRLKQAGVDRYLLRHETASDALYKSLHPDGSLTERKDALYALKELGYQVGAGFMVGLPGQKRADLVKDLRFLKTLDPAMVGIGPFIPHSATPLAGGTAGTLEQTLDMVALVRLLLPKSLLPATTALGTLDPMGREKALMAGANVVMPNLSPTQNREQYELYENKICTGDEAAHCRICIEKRIQRAGFTADFGRGDYDEWRTHHDHPSSAH